MILVDDRELTQHPDIPDKIKIPVVSERLDAGDYGFQNLYHDPIGIERSEINNLVQKLKSGELEDQLRRCVDNYSTVILLVEGVYDSIGGYLAIYKSSGKGYYRSLTHSQNEYTMVQALLTRLQQLGILVVHTANFDCSMETIRTIYMQYNKDEKTHNLFKKVRAPHIPVRSTTNPAVPRLMALCPRLPERVAIRLIQKYGCIMNILVTPEADLIQVEGFGKGLYKKLYETLYR